MILSLTFIVQQHILASFVRNQIYYNIFLEIKLYLEALELGHLPQHQCLQIQQFVEALLWKACCR